MYTENWLKLHRKIFDNEIWDDLKLFRFFVYLIGQAVFAKSGVDKGNIHIKRGQLLKSYRKIQDELQYIENNSVKQYSLSVIKRMIKKLKDKEMIETKTTKLGTLFTIINYAKYQDREAEKDKRIKELRTELEQQKNSRRTAEEHLRNNNKNVKNVKKVNKEKNVLSNSCSDSKKQNQNPKFDIDSMQYKAAAYLRKLILDNNKREPVPDKNTKDLEDWAVELDRLNRLGPPGAKNKGYDWKEIGQIMEWCQDDSFWRKNIKSASKFRKQITKLEDNMKNDTTKKSDNRMDQLKELYAEAQAEDENGKKGVDIL